MSKLIDGSLFFQLFDYLHELDGHIVFLA